MAEWGWLWAFALGWLRLSGLPPPRKHVSEGYTMPRKPINPSFLAMTGRSDYLEQSPGTWILARAPVGTEFKVSATREGSHGWIEYTVGDFKAPSISIQSVDPKNIRREVEGIVDIFRKRCREDGFNQYKD